MGVTAGVWLLDGITKAEVAKAWDLSPFLYSNGPQIELRIGLDLTHPYDTRWLDFSRWQPANVYDANADFSWSARKPSTLRARVRGFAGLTRDVGGGTTHAFERIEGELRQVGTFGAAHAWTHRLRVFGGASHDAPLQRSIGLSSLDVTDTYTNDFVRGRDALFGRSDVHFVVPGGAGLRGYSPLVRVDRAAAAERRARANRGEGAREIVRARDPAGGLWRRRVGSAAVFVCWTHSLLMRAWGFSRATSSGTGPSRCASMCRSTYAIRSSRLVARRATIV